MKYENGSDTSGSGGLFYDLNFPADNSRVVPVIGVSGQLIRGEGRKGHIYDASLGLRVFASDDVSMNFRAYYSISEQEDEAGGFFTANEVEYKNFGVRFGFSWFVR